MHKDCENCAFPKKGSLSLHQTRWKSLMFLLRNRSRGACIWNRSLDIWLRKCRSSKSLRRAFGRMEIKVRYARLFVSVWCSIQTIHFISRILNRSRRVDWIFSVYTLCARLWIVLVRGNQASSHTGRGDFWKVIIRWGKTETKNNKRIRKSRVYLYEWSWGDYLARTGGEEKHRESATRLIAFDLHADGACEGAERGILSWSQHEKIANCPPLCDPASVLLGWP